MSRSQETPQERLRVISRRVPPASQANDALVIGAAVAAALGGLGFGAGLLLEAPVSVYGSALAIGLFALGLAVRRFFTDRFPDVEAVEERATDVEPDQGAIADVTSIQRRPLLLRVLVAAAGVFGISVLAPPVASLGPAPGNALRVTAWEKGRRLVDAAGNPLRPETIAVGGVSTVWPEGAIGLERSAAIVVRLSGGQPQPPTRLEWVVDDTLVAYSKVCTHAGCPVGLFRERDSVLFCPCHQSTFDAQRGAIPTFGPTARALPQLPMGIDDQGFLIALSDFTQQVGPAFG